MIYCDTWALIYTFKLQCFETVLVTALHTNLKKKYVFGIDKACDSILMWHGDIVFKNGIPVLRWQTVTKSEVVFDYEFNTLDLRCGHGEIFSE